MLFAVDGMIGENAAVRQVAAVLDQEIGALQIDDDWNTDIGSVGDHTTLHYTYTGSVSITNRALADNHGMSLNILLFRSLALPTPRVYLKTQNCTKRQEKDIKGFYHRQYKEVIA